MMQQGCEDRALRDRVAAIMYDVDPYGFNDMLTRVDAIPVPPDEYMPEVRVVLPQLLTIESRDRLVQLLVATFTATGEGPGLTEALNVLADRLYDDVVLPAREQNKRE